MVDVDSLLSEARKFALMHFGSHPDRQALICDVQSLSWEYAEQDGWNHDPERYVWYAIRDVRNGRQFRMSVRSIDSPMKVRGRLNRPTRFSGFNLEALFHDQNPARIASFKIDYTEWLSTLTSLQRRMVDMLAEGNTTQEVARLLKCGEPNVSDFRRRLRESWYRFTADRE